MWDQPLTDTEIETKIRNMISRAGTGHAILGYFICDEPGASMFPRLAKAVKYVRKYAPGKIISQIETDVPMMVGEFKNKEGEKYVMIVNLSLKKSAPFKIITHENLTRVEHINAVNGHVVPFDTNKDYWLVAGQGILIKL